MHHHSAYPPTEHPPMVEDGKRHHQPGAGPSKRSCNDVFFAILFYLQLAAVIGLGIWGVRRQNESSPGSPSNNDDNAVRSDHWPYYLAILGACTVLTFLFAFFVVFLTRKIPRQLIITANILFIALMLGVAVYYLAIGLYWPGGISLLFAVINILWLWWCGAESPLPA
eukprot:EC690507.1.p1 GENE.EC690507.1~~EC690507.1.p1  ORF type:complete len:168 (+),score=24.53 EC690507.1:110-613(+)